MEEKPKRRWLRYSVRTLLVAVTIFCVWLGYTLNWIHARHQFLNSLETARYIRDGEHPSYFAINTAPWSLRVFGETGVRKISCREEPAHKTISRARSLFPEAELFWDNLLIED